mmetsp:Transcript_22036/g.47920  ORF Transcript_22036/g.47920 Transcript_22036/m.47920 type:complete len:400 (-) Transcript_22036:30-1229(-)
MNQQRQRFQPPELYSISRGVVSRIEPYGCFVKLESSPISGLVHISQLHANRITDVSDVVSLDDEVWVKVMDVQVESIEDDTGRTRQRHKVKLSMKYVHQDTGQDLDPENEQLEGDMQRSTGGGGGGPGGGGGGIRGNAIDGTGGANSQLGRSLASNIGMSIAIDPGNLILKGKSAAAVAANTDFNGYALVGEDEGEAPMEKQHAVEVKPEPVVVVRSMGRGRGTTLPAWMTRSDPKDRLGSTAGMPDLKEATNEKEDDRKSSDNHKKSRKHDKRHRKERHHKYGRHSGRKHHKKHKDRKRKDRRGRSRSNSYSSYSSSSSIASRSHSKSRSRSPERRSHSRSHRKKKSHKHGRRQRDRSRSHDNGGPLHQSSEFTNVEEARAIMERLERRRKEGQQGGN